MTILVRTWLLRIVGGRGYPQHQPGPSRGRSLFAGKNIVSETPEPEVPGKLRYYSYRLPDLVFCRSSTWRRPSLISQLTAFIPSRSAETFLCDCGFGFQLTHQALGRNWSVSLDVRESHQLVTDGIYRKIRHPVYSAFWLWAVARVLLLPNWIAGFAGLVGFGTLYFGRVAREERMMLETFGDSYRVYMARTGRVFPRIL